MDPIVSFLREARKRQRMSQEALSQLLGRSTYQTVWQWESGTNSPKLENLRDWANALGYDLVLIEREKTIAKEHRMEMPETSIETRVRFVFKEALQYPGAGRSAHVSTYSDSWFGDTPDGAANYPWLMNNAIVWVEERVVYKPGEWTVSELEEV